MANLSAVSGNTEKEQSSDTEKCTEACKEMFSRILSHVLEGGNQEAHKMEESIYRKITEPGLLFLQLFLSVTTGAITERQQKQFGELLREGEQVRRCTFRFSAN